MVRALQLAGKKFGMLTVIERSSTKGGCGSGIYWNCRCDCGNHILAYGTTLNAGGKKSCGCNNKKAYAKNGGIGKNLIDLTLRKFGRLSVVRRFDSKTRSGARWECRCDCGRVTVSDGYLLRTGRSKSCGCLKLEMLQERNSQASINANAPEAIAAKKQKNSARARVACEKIKYYYVRRLFVGKTGLSSSEIPQELVDLKRMHLRLVRLLKEKTNGFDDGE